MSAWSDVEETILRDSYPLVGSLGCLELLPGRSKTAIRSRAKLLKLKKQRAPNRAGLLLSDEPKAMYWLGFLLADGHFGEQGKIKLCVSVKDAAHVLAYEKFIGGKSRSVSVNSFGQERQMLEHGVSNVAVVRELSQRYGICSSKTKHPPLFPTGLSDDSLLALIVGFIDGDGTVKRLKGRPDSNIQIKNHSAWGEFLQHMSDFLGHYFSAHPVAVKTTSGYAVLCLSNSRVVSGLKKQLVRLGIPYMTRKWSRIDENFVSSRAEKTTRKMPQKNFTV